MKSYIHGIYIDLLSLKGTRLVSKDLRHKEVVCLFVKIA